MPAEHAGDALGWAQRLRASGDIGEFALTPASLEDVYVDLVSDRTGAAPPMLLAPSKEVSHARAA